MLISFAETRTHRGLAITYRLYTRKLVLIHSFTHFNPPYHHLITVENASVRK